MDSPRSIRPSFAKFPSCGSRILQILYWRKVVALQREFTIGGGYYARRRALVRRKLAGLWLGFVSDFTTDDRHYAVRLHNIRLGYGHDVRRKDRELRPLCHPHA